MVDSCLDKLYRIEFSISVKITLIHYFLQAILLTILVVLKHLKHDYLANPSLQLLQTDASIFVRINNKKRVF